MDGGRPPAAGALVTGGGTTGKNVEGKEGGRRMEEGVGRREEGLERREEGAGKVLRATFFQSQTDKRG